jgi:hypothetical protein
MEAVWPIGTSTFKKSDRRQGLQRAVSAFLWTLFQIAGQTVSSLAILGKK